MKSIVQEMADRVLNPHDGPSYFSCSTNSWEPMQELRRHVTDAAIAQQLTPPTRAQWLAKCDRVLAAQAGR